MEAKELRIGNIMNYHGQTVIVLEIYRDGASFGYFNDSIGFVRRFYDNDCPVPIPITEEWLERFGFVLEMDSMHRHPNCSQIDVFFHDQGFEVMVDSVCKKHVRDIHLLQNLYFALKGEELELKEINNTSSPEKNNE